MSECGHHRDYHHTVVEDYWAVDCGICGCDEYRARRDPAYDPDDVRDIGYHERGLRL